MKTIKHIPLYLPLALTLAAAFMATNTIFAQSDQNSPLRDWTPEISARLAYYSVEGENLSARFAPRTKRLLTVSPDGKHFFVARRHGDIERDQNVYELLIWDSAEVAHALRVGGPAPKPWKTLRASNGANSDYFSALDRPQFIEGGRTLLYLGMDDATGRRNVFQLDLSNGQTAQLTNNSTDVRDYAWKNGTLFFVSHREGEPPEVPPLDYPMAPLGKDRFAGVVSPRIWTLQGVTGWGDDSRVFAQVSGADKVELPKATAVGSHLPALNKLAPGGKALVYREPMNAWTGGPPFADWDKPSGEKVKLLAPTRMIHFDLTSGRQTVLAEGQFFWPNVEWAPNGDHVLLVGVRPTNPSIKARFGAIAIIDPASGRREDIAGYYSDYTAGKPLHTSTVKWFRPDAVLVVEGGSAIGEPTGKIYELRESNWVARPARSEEIALATTGKNEAAEVQASLPDGVQVGFHEGLNEPPVLVATLGGNSLALTERDPLLKEVWWARAEPFSWTEQGKTVSGNGLIRLPRNYHPGDRIPFVIVVEYVENEKFYPEAYAVGAATSAVQSLLAHGIGVLVIRPTYLAGRVLPDEVPRTLAQIEGATAALINSGKADAARLGIVGFSHTGYSASLAITHPGKYPFAAAIADDSFTGTFLEYLLDSAWDVGDYYGGDFWSSKEAWLKYAPDFNMDKVRTPMMLTNHGVVDPPAIAPAIRNEYSIIMTAQVASYELADRPVEALKFPDGSHQLQRPKEIIAVQQAAVDWFCFWLKGEVPANPIFAERWLPLRAMQQNVLDDLAAKGTTVAPLPALVQSAK